MKKKDIEYFKELLTNRLEELLSQADNTVSGMTTPKKIFRTQRTVRPLNQTGILCFV